MNKRRSAFTGSKVLPFPGPGGRSPTPRSLRLVEPLPCPPVPPDQSDTFETRPGSPLESGPTTTDETNDETIVDGELGTLVCRPPEAIPAAPETELMLGRPTPPAPIAAPPEPSVANLTEVMFHADPAMFSPKRPLTEPRDSRSDSDHAPERPSTSPALVAHVIPPQRNYAIVAALLAWTLAVAFGVYVITMHRASPAPAPFAPTPALPAK